MTANFFSPEAEMALMAEEEVLGQLFPASTCQSPPSIMYSPPLHSISHRSSLGQPQPGGYYSPQPDYRPTVASTYPPQPYWTSHPAQMAHTHPSYSTYPPPTGTLAPTAAFQATSSPMYSSQMSSTRASRSPSASSTGGLAIPTSRTATTDSSRTALSRSLSPSAPDLRAYGYPNKNGTWTCAYPGCTSRAVFTRGCDLRKHHKRHTKSFFCRHEGCPQATGGGFSSKKDLARHEAKHNPGVMCEWQGCDRVFSRVDNMVSQPPQDLSLRIRHTYLLH